MLKSIPVTIKKINKSFLTRYIFREKMNISSIQRVNDSRLKTARPLKIYDTRLERNKMVVKMLVSKGVNLTMINKVNYRAFSLVKGT